MLSRISRLSVLSHGLNVPVRTSIGRSSVQLLCIRQIPSVSFNYVVVRHFSNEKKEVKLQDRVFTIPNIMSATRFVLAPVIGYMIVKGCFIPSYYIAFAFASVLDFADGYIARTFNQRSRLGTLIDPIADKALMVCLGISMGYAGLIHAPVAGLIIGKDILMGLGFFGICWKQGYHKPREMMEMVKHLEIKPSLLGKANTALQMSLFLLGLTRPLWGFPSVQLFLPLEAIVSCTTVASLVSYAFTTNKAVKWSEVKKDVKKEEVVKQEDADSNNIQ